MNFIKTMEDKIKEKKIRKFLHDNDWYRCNKGHFHHYDNFYLDGKKLTHKQAYEVGLKLFDKECPNE